MMPYVHLVGGRFTTLVGLSQGSRTLSIQCSNACILDYPRSNLHSGNCSTFLTSPSGGGIPKLQQSSKLDHGSSSPFRIPHRNYSLTAEDPYRNDDRITYEPIFKYKYITHLALISRLKIYQATLAVILGGLQVGGIAEFSQGTAIGAAVFGVTSLATLCFFSVYFQRVIGFVSVSMMDRSESENPGTADSAARESNIGRSKNLDYEGDGSKTQYENSALAGDETSAQKRKAGTGCSTNVQSRKWEDEGASGYPNPVVRLSKLTFWGQRTEVYVPADAIVPLSDVTDVGGQRLDVFQPVLIYKSKERFYLPLRHPRYINMGEMERAFGILT